jgi:hypothetical protein
MLNNLKICHRPLYAGDPICFFEEGKWVARTSRAMTSED